MVGTRNVLRAEAGMKCALVSVSFCCSWLCPLRQQKALNVFPVFTLQTDMGQVNGQVDLAKVSCIYKFVFILALDQKDLHLGFTMNLTKLWAWQWDKVTLGDATQEEKCKGKGTVPQTAPSRVSTQEPRLFSHFIHRKSASSLEHFQCKGQKGGENYIIFMIGYIPESNPFENVVFTLF